MKTLREILIALAVVLVWVGVARLADADMRARERVAMTAPAAT